MKSLTREQWIGAVLALAVTLGSVGYMYAKSNELSEAARKGQAERLKNLDLAPPKPG